MMHKIKIELRFVLIFSLVLVLFGACSDDDYFTADPVRKQTAITSDTYTYLSSKPDQFGAFVELIDLTDSKDLVNGSNSTILAPQNYSVNRLVEELGKESLADIQSDLLMELVKKYVVTSKITSEDLNEPVTVTNVFGHELVFEIKREVWKGVDNIGPQYISVYNLKDSDVDTDDIEVKVVTPDLETSSGIIQVLAKEHLFGF